MKLKVGMYCFCKQRRNLGIGKILNVSELANVAVQFKNHAEVFVSNNLVASENIIDLIQLGDYVNGVEVIEIYNKGNKFKGSSMYSFKEKTIELDNDNYETIPTDCLITNEEIENIVTKEQFNSEKYEVE